MAITLGNLGEAQKELGNVAEARELLTRALAIEQPNDGLASFLREQLASLPPVIGS